MRLWHLYHGFETTGWANGMYGDGIGWGLAAPNVPSFYMPFDLSYIVVDFREVIGRQMSHAVNTSGSDSFNMSLSFNAAGMTTPNLGIYIDSFQDATDRLQNTGSRISRTLPQTARIQLLEKARIGKTPIIKTRNIIDVDSALPDSITSKLAIRKGTRRAKIGGSGSIQSL